MNYKEGDHVRIKSIDWYFENKDKDGFIHCGEYDFVPQMSVFCGKILTIDVDFENETYLMKEDTDGFVFTIEMIDCLVERNGKTYPYKIGDRVVLKGNNRCATITDLKYNSWGNLSYYIKIDNDKDISVDYPTDLLLPYDNMIEELVEKENNDCEKCSLTRNSTRCLFVDNCPHNKQKNMIEELVEKESSIDLTAKGEEVKKRIEIRIPEGYEYVIESGKIIFTKKKKEYPKTYKECCRIMDIDTGFLLTSYDIDFWKGHLLTSLQKLLICRDAYWKIAGEEMGLDKPWEPDWIEERYIIYRNQDDIIRGYRAAGCEEHYILSFPTAEMRDSFYENFKEDIEKCKELL